MSKSKKSNPYKLSIEDKDALKVLGHPNTKVYQGAKDDFIRYGKQVLDPQIINSYNADNNVLGRRAFIPLAMDPSLYERLGNRASTIANGNGIYATEKGPRYLSVNSNTGYIEYGPLLETKGKPKLAINSTNENRRRYAGEVFKIAMQQNPQLSAEALESLAARKYEMANAKGKQGHHMYPVSYSGRIMNSINEVGLQDEVIDEIIARHLYIGDQAKNIAPLQTKENELGPSKYLSALSNENNVDIHDRVHARAEELIAYGGLPVRTNVSEGSTIEDFILNDDKSDFQKTSYAIAVPEAHRVAMQAENLDLTKEVNQKRVINSLIELAALKSAAEQKMSPRTEEIIKSTGLVRKSNRRY